jgi:hypothetical protein
MTFENQPTSAQVPAEESTPETVPAEQEGTTAPDTFEETTDVEPIPETEDEQETFDSPTSNDVGEQTLTNADKQAATDAEEAFDEASEEA